MKSTRRNAARLMVLEFRALVRHFGVNTDIGDVLVVMFVVDKYVASGVRVMCLSPSR
jgi:hypothetical protein